ncbi:hypothetical protein FJZ36_07855 [Candidatus Poribacteria bacterium]|nr:hypothetical protein [Candidatus Poribacteria bacterium]
MIRHLAVLARKDLALQWQSRDALLLVVLFALIVLLVFAFAYGPYFAPLELDADARRLELGKLASAVFWIAISFAGVIALNRSAEMDRTQGAIQSIRLAGIRPEAIYLSRVLAMTVLLLGVEVVLAPLAVVFLQVRAFALPDAARLAGIALLGTVGFSALGSFLSAMTASVRGRESFLSVLLLPLLVPLLIAATKCSVPVFAAEPLRDTSWLGLLGGYPFVCLAVCTLLFESILEE